MLLTILGKMASLMTGSILACTIFGWTTYHGAQVPDAALWSFVIGVCLTVHLMTFVEECGEAV